MNVNKDDLCKKFTATRNLSEEICQSLSPEDMTVQPADFVSPPKWHLAHTSWFFETFVLKEFSSFYLEFNDSFGMLFNSYYKTQGKHWLRNCRGHLSRPSSKEIIRYRKHVDNAIAQIAASSQTDDILQRIELGIQHEQQHQELLLMDIKYILSRGSVGVPYVKGEIGHQENIKLKFNPFAGGLIHLGVNENNPNFKFDNETPSFDFLLYDFALANRPITNGEFLEFISDGGYDDALLWKSDGWDYINNQENRTPLYWRKRDDQWFEYTLYGEKPLNPDSPVCHINFYEADAYASWSGSRLPTEMELEYVYSKIFTHEKSYDNYKGFLDSSSLHPHLFQEPDCNFFSLNGNLWEWTGSGYLPYPRYRKPQGAFGEYNQKFMINQMVLRGGSCVTPRCHFRLTYRNFFYPHQKWAFTGLRLAKDI